MPTYTSHNLKETREVAEKVLGALKEKDTADVLALYGELGAGKTAFVKACSEILGITDRVMSPTFILERVYKVPRHDTFSHFIHIDAYRLESADELETLGWRELIQNPTNLIAVEWADRVEEALPKNALHISFKTIDENTREISW